LSDHQAFIKLIGHPVKFRMFLFLKIPAAFFSGVRVRYIDQEKCIVSIPFTWFNQNPFRSTYFACLSMAAEMSTGTLAMTWVHKRNPAVSMLVTKVDGDFTKKATGLVLFTCEQGLEFKEAIDRAIQTGTPQTIIAHSIGKNKNGEVVAEFKVTWSFKAKVLVVNNEKMQN
jgi:hypothetical protein